MLFSEGVDGSFDDPDDDFEGLRTGLGPSYRPSRASVAVERLEKGLTVSESPMKKPEVADALDGRLDVFLTKNVRGGAHQ